MIRLCVPRPILLMCLAWPAFMLSGDIVAQDPAGEEPTPQETAKPQRDDSSSERVAGAGPKRSPGSRRWGASLPAVAPAPATPSTDKIHVTPIPLEELAGPLKLQRKAEARIRRALQTKVTVEFEETALKDVLFELAAQGEIPLVLDWGFWQEEGISG